MPDSKITALASIGTGADPANDPLVIVDVSDTSMAASGTTKKITSNQILGAGGTATLASATITGSATVGTTLGVTGAATFSGAVVCNGAVTLGDAVGDAINATGSLTAYNGQAPSAIRAAASDYAAVNFDGATSGTRIISTLTGQNIGTGDMSMWNRFRVFTTTGTTRYIASLSSSSTTADQARACLLYINSIGGLVFYLYGATVSDFRSGTIAGFQTAYSGQVVDVVVTRTGATLKIYINGTDTAYSETTGGTPPAWSETITSTNLFIGQSTGTSNIFTGRIYRSVVFNRALSAADVTELITTGVNPADQWGTQTALVSGSTLNGNFETWTVDGVAGVSNGTATSWSITSVGAGNTVTKNSVAPISGTFDALLTMGATSGLVAANASSVTIPLGKRVRAAISANRLSGVGALQLVNGTSNTVVKTILLTTGSTVTDSTEYVCDGPRPYWLLSTTNTVVQIDNAIVERIGAIVDLDFTVGTGYQATDRSTNALHGTLFNGVEFTQPKQVAVLYATTSTNGNQQMLGTLAIPTNAIIEDIIVNSTGSATVSVGNASAGTQIVNGASVVSGRQKLTIATPFSTTGNLWVNSNSTATLQFTILYTIAS